MDSRSSIERMQSFYRERSQGNPKPFDNRYGSHPELLAHEKKIPTRYKITKANKTNKSKDPLSASLHRNLDLNKLVES